MSDLSRREQQVLFLIALGHSSNAIALQLGLADSTVGTYRRNLRHKLGCRNRAQFAALALTLAPGIAPRAAISDLTPRQGQILRRIALGHTSKEIANELRLSPATIRKHREKLHQKTGARNAAQLVLITRTG